MRRLIVALLLVIMASGSASAFVVPSPEPEIVSTAREIPSDPKLPKYNNPTEIDLEDGKLHISFKGAFRRHVDKDKKPDNCIVFCFVATPKRDMMLKIAQSELFDGKATRFDRGNWIPGMGQEGTWEREIIEGIPLSIRFGYEMPESRAGLLPTIARVNFTFNGQTFQFRNIKAEEWSVWEEIAQNLGI